MLAREVLGTFTTHVSLRYRCTLNHKMAAPMVMQLRGSNPYLKINKRDQKQSEEHCAPEAVPLVYLIITYSHAR